MKYLSYRHRDLNAYVPGEQPQDREYIKLNTNENPFPVSKKALAYAAENTKALHLYPDPDCRELTELLSKKYSVSNEEIILTNGSDELLSFAFMAFCDEKKGAVMPDITYGFYEVFAKLYNIKYRRIPLKDDFSISCEDYVNAGGTIFLANPNAPTGRVLGLSEIEKIVASNPDNVVVIDEAYIDFGADSCVSLIHKYDNLLVSMTFSKSRSMAGGRLGFGIGCKDIIQDLNKMKYSTNPYNVNSMTAALGIGILKDEEYTEKNCRAVISNRNMLSDALQNIGFDVIPSYGNFVFVRYEGLSGEGLYLELKKRGILVRYFNSERTKDYIRITIGSLENTEILIAELKNIIKN